MVGVIIQHNIDEEYFGNYNWLVDELYLFNENNEENKNNNIKNIYDLDEIMNIKSDILIFFYDDFFKEPMQKDLKDLIEKILRNKKYINILEENKIIEIFNNKVILDCAVIPHILYLYALDIYNTGIYSDVISVTTVALTFKYFYTNIHTKQYYQHLDEYYYLLAKCEYELNNYNISAERIIVCYSLNPLEMYRNFMLPLLYLVDDKHKQDLIRRINN